MFRGDIFEDLLNGESDDLSYGYEFINFCISCEVRTFRVLFVYHLLQRSFEHSFYQAMSLKQLFVNYKMSKKYIEFFWLNK